jgi:DNA-binding NarL/FixJ family response regulator
LRACDFDVVGEAGSGNEAIVVVSRERPDVVLMDLGLPDMGGVMAIQHITAANPKVRVVVITLYDDDESVRNALEAGASGYIVKDANPDQIIAALRQLNWEHSGWAAACRVLEHLSRGPTQTSLDSPGARRQMPNSSERA